MTNCSGECKHQVYKSTLKYYNLIRSVAWIPGPGQKVPPACPAPPWSAYLAWVAEILVELAKQTAPVDTGCDKNCACSEYPGQDPAWTKPTELKIESSKLKLDPCTCWLEATFDIQSRVFNGLCQAGKKPVEKVAEEPSETKEKALKKKK